MAATSFKLRDGLIPADLRAYPDDVRKQYWTWVGELAIKAKVKDLRAGLDKDGNPLRAISARTRKYRKSAMTPSGKGDPSAPPLIPGRLLSRTISLLAFRALSTHVDMFWRYDAFSGDSWGKVLAIQARHGRDVFGLSPDGTARVRVAAWDRWEKWKHGKYPAQPVKVPTIAAAVGIPQAGSYDMSKATFGIGASSEAHFARGTWTGGMTRAESDRYFREPARVEIPGRPGTAYNRLLGHVWGRQQPPGTARPAPKPPPPVRPAAAAPRPAPVSFAQAVQAAVEAVPETRLFGGHKAFIHDVWAAYVAQTGDAITLAEFKARLLADPAMRAMMARADMVQGHSAADLAASEAAYTIGGAVAATFNFLRRRKR